MPNHTTWDVSQAWLRFMHELVVHSEPAALAHSASAAPRSEGNDLVEGIHQIVQAPTLQKKAQLTPIGFSGRVLQPSGRPLQDSLSLGIRHVTGRERLLELVDEGVSRHSDARNSATTRAVDVASSRSSPWASPPDTKSPS